MAKDLKIWENFYFGASPEIIRRARLLRMNLTLAEKTLWELLRRKRLNGIRFRRQHPISCFIVDFYCHQAGLVIEIDGKVHVEKDQAEHDQDRSFELEKLGLKVIRFDNEEVLINTLRVLAKIQDELANVQE